MSTCDDETCEHGVSMDDECLLCLQECAIEAVAHFQRVADRCSALIAQGKTNYSDDDDA